MSRHRRPTMRHGRPTGRRSESNRACESATRSCGARSCGPPMDIARRSSTFKRDKWRAITSASRHFGIDPQRPYVVEVTAPTCRSVLGVTSLEYLSNGHVAPRVGLRISILEAGIVARLDSDGTLDLASSHTELSATCVLLNLAVLRPTSAS